MTRRRSLVVAAALAVAGLALALALAREHARAHAGIESFCAINDVVNCDRVATSRFSVALGLPLAVWGAFGYALALLLAVMGLRPRRPHDTWPAGLLLLLAAAATAAAVALALVSELVIGALCLLCAGSWLVSAALLAAAFAATRPLGAAAAVRADLALLRARPARTAGVLLAGAASVALVAAAYPRYWERPPRAAAAPARPAATSVPPAPPAPSGAAKPSAAAARVVVSFSDYACPFCALAHDEAKAALAARPDVTLVRKHFPLDSACNPAVTRAMHPGACLLAAAAICAEEQGRLEAMDDALFANQKARKPLDRIAADLALDAPRFEACLRAPATQRRLQADIAAGLAVGVRATPTWVVNGVARSGNLPLDLLPPPP